MAWLFLFLAGIFEVVWATTMKLSNGFTEIWYTIFTILGMVLSFLFLSISLKQLPLSLAYPIWTGIGAVGALVLGVFLFQDRIAGSTWFFVALLIIGLIGIKVTSGH
ncbi:multidrug efflux SMR transporter [Weissella diestrammenae]|uniref:Multidrug efflux SMR transporter n=1 Tax=Weissella diestrammenae TaxID=1162633 RepID=A0A7G9T5B8_9LACO|nr:multidrug efflux SMR transporter [Weissella diestrammenae]MCM0583151.1 multidrug efflux SMR transporter [Weissella diestrammenae]QNN75293.1 multidrug efflux SMR transporter [Weissella diestrammenae]